MGCGIAGFKKTRNVLSLCHGANNLTAGNGREL